jgi:hypothetical protein
VIWRTRAGESPAAAASVRIEIPSARAEAGAQLRSRSACSRRHAVRETRVSTGRSRRQAAIRSVIVTMTPLQMFSELDSQRRFLAPLLPAPLLQRCQAETEEPYDVGRRAKLIVL